MFYLTGRFEGSGSVMRFQKRNARLRWFLKFNQMTNIRSYYQVEGEDYLYGCGDYFRNEEAMASDMSKAQFSAAFFKLDNEGEVRWYIEAAGVNPGAQDLDQDRCMGISFDTTSRKVSILLQAKMKELRYHEPGDFYDTVLAILDESGSIEKGVSISNSYIKFDMYSANQGLMQLGDAYYFAGWSKGYKTRMQTLDKKD